MRELRKLYLLCAALYFVATLTVMPLACSLLGKPVDWMLMLVLAPFWALMGMASFYVLTGSFLKTRLRFLTSAGVAVPAFGGKVERTVQLDGGRAFSFEVIKYRIAERCLITYYDDTESHVVKFRRRFTLASWGSAGCVVYDPVSQTLSITCFPMVGNAVERSVRETQALADEVESVVSR